MGSTRGVSIGRGLARMESPDGTIISYATQAGRTAVDGLGRNSPYTTAFLRYVEDKDDIATVFRHISANVYEISNGTQLPELSLSFFGDFYLNGKLQVTTRPIPPPVRVDPCAAAEAHWKSAEAIGSIAAFEDHLAQFPNCAFAGLAKSRIQNLKDKLAAVVPPVPLTKPNDSILQGAAFRAAECERLAAPPPPFASPAQLKAAAHVDWALALRTCEDATKGQFNDPRLQFLSGRAYDKSKGYVEAGRRYQTAADAGYTAAQNALGLLFVLGRGVIQDYQHAFDLFNKAAIAGDGEAMGNLGSMYGNGYFVKKDDAKALYWYEKSIEAGNAFGLAQAGVMYFNGQGTPRDYQAAAQYFEQAADLGDGYSLKFLALMYERGLLGKPDPAKAAELKRKAAEVDPDSQDPNVPQPPRKAATKTERTFVVRHVVIRHYHFNGCNWMWC